jgi:ribosome-associated protein
MGKAAARDGVLIPLGQVVFESYHASGPGGQNVNKVDTAVRLRFDLAASPSLTPELKIRLRQLAGRKMTAEGVLLIEAHRYRTQEQNRRDALARLTILLERACERPRPRHSTRPGPAANRSRLEGKKKRGELKRTRRRVRIDPPGS